MDAVHVVCTVIEVMAAACLLWRQRVLQARRPMVQWRVLFSRVKSRLLACPSRRAAGTLFGITFIGSGLLGGVGFVTGFLKIGLPSNWHKAALQLGAVLFMPGLLEEVIFRGLLYRDSEAECANLPGSGSSSRVFADFIHTPVAGSGAMFRPVSSALDTTSRWLGCAESPTSSQWIGCIGSPTRRDVHDDYTQMLSTQTGSTSPASSPGRNQPSAWEPHVEDGWPEDVEKAAHVSFDCDCRFARTVAEVPCVRPPVEEQAAALFIFVVYHLDIIHSWPVFRDPRFLLLAAILGVCCQEAMLRSQSLWPGIVLHGVWVWLWLTFGRSS